MNTRMTLPVQWSITLLFGLFLGYAYQPLGTPVESVELPLPIPLPATAFITTTSTSSPASFVTLPGGLLVRVKFFRNDVPQIEKIILLEQARITVFPKGNNHIEILAESGQVLYAQSFLVEFLDGDPPKPVDSKTMIFVLPSMEGAAEVVITTSNGKVNYDIPAR